MGTAGEVRNILISGHLAHPVTLEPDGSPQVSLVWVGVDGDEIVARHLGVWRKVANIKRDRRVALSMETGGHAANRFAEYLVVYDTARITEDGAATALGLRVPPLPGVWSDPAAAIL